MPAYDNTAVAAKLELAADLLEISGADKFRFLSYRKAANAVRAWPEQVAALANEGRLTEIPGVGAKMAGNIEQLVVRGSFDGLDELTATLPATLAEVMQLPGVGPKRAAQLHDKLGVGSLAELDAALADGSVARLGGVGAKTAERIAASLEAHRRHRARTPIGAALPAAELLAADIAALPTVERVEVAGSVRRRAETVGNIDLVVATHDSEAAAAAIAALPAVECTVEPRDAGELAVELHDGLRVDVHFARAEQFGAALRHFTGSVEHNEAVVLLGAMRGIEVGERAIYRDHVAVDAPQEADVFAALGIEPLPPEAREGTETLALAAHGAFPRLVDLADVRGDLQSHSTYTDGKTTLEQNRAVAAELGYGYLAATDHAWALRMVGGLSVADLERQWAEIDRLNEGAAEQGLPLILKGIELNIGHKGELDYDDDVLARFDIVLASLHSGWDEDEATATARVLRAIEHPLVDVIAHPTGRVLGRRDPIRLDVPAMLEAAGETGTIMEINSYPDRLDLSAEHIALARRYGVRFSLGTDAHAAEQLRYMRYGVAQARRGLVTCEELVNARPWEVARTWLKRQRTLSGGAPA